MRLHRIDCEGQARLVRERDGKSALLAAGLSLGKILAQADPSDFLRKLDGEAMDPARFRGHRPLAPIEDQEVWACGVTYFNSRRARLAESGENATVYDQVYLDPRPQIFPKARGRNVAGPGEALTLRPDSGWIVPEPELVLVLSAAGRLVGVTAGNDLSCRDIEGKNPLYQPQAKIWQKSCGLGPGIEFTADLAAIQKKTITLEIARGAETVFRGESSPAEIVRPFSLLAETLFKYRSFPDGAFLFTGTGIVPPGEFCLREADLVRISLEGVGTLENPMATAGGGA